MDKLTLREVAVNGQRVLVRVDYNVPIADGHVTDDTRIKATLPTLDYLHAEKAKIIICSHFGRPNGEVVESERLGIVVDHLRSITHIPVKYVTQTIGAEATTAATHLRPGEILVLENLRFHPGEESNDPAFAKALSAFGTLFVNDAFGAAHRAHASTSGITQFLPAVAGLLMEKELTMLGSIISNPHRPVTAIIGGSKVSDKIDIISNLIRKVDNLLVGGGMVATFLKAQGYQVGASMVEDNQLGTALQIIQDASAAGVNLILPVDLVVANIFSSESSVRTVGVGEVPTGWFIMDIGSSTRERFIDRIGFSSTILWNGPLGVFEWQSFSNGTRVVAQAIAAQDEAVTVVGGGSTVEATRMFGISELIDHVSTGGGATLEFLEGRTLPGVDALSDQNI